MAWARNDYIAGSAFDYNEANAIGDSIRTWQGSVNANGNNLSSLATLTMVGNGGVTLNKFSPIGYAGGVANTDASLVFYKNDANNWAGAGADQSGNLWIRTGIVANSAPTLTILSDGSVVVNRGKLAVRASSFHRFTTNTVTLAAGASVSISSLLDGAGNGMIFIVDQNAAIGRFRIAGGLNFVTVSENPDSAYTNADSGTVTSLFSAGGGAYTLKNRSSGANQYALMFLGFGS